jgi:hypothetical protein
MDDLYDDYASYEEDEKEQRPRDPKVDAAKQGLMARLFTAEPERVFYGRQIEVRFEEDFYHWITDKALRELVDENKIQSTKVQVGEGLNLRFYWSKGNRYWKRQAGGIQKLVEEYSRPQFTSALGSQGETMFDAALPTAGFLPTARKVRAYNSRQWTKTGHDLDRVFERDGVA